MPSVIPFFLPARPFPHVLFILGGLGLPDRSTFSKNRHGRFRDSGLLRGLPLRARSDVVLGAMPKLEVAQRPPFEEAADNARSEKIGTERRTCIRTGKTPP